jgi:hypothetical protein
MSDPSKETFVICAPADDAGRIMASSMRWHRIVVLQEECPLSFDTSDRNAEILDIPGH